MASNEQPTSIQNVELVQFLNHGTTAPDPTASGLSGTLSCSGGSLTYIGSAGTITQLAAA